MENRRTLLTKPLWNLNEIQFYFGVGKTKASRMMQAAKKVSSSRFCPSKAKRDALLEINGIDYKEEVSKLNMLEVSNGNS